MTFISTATFRELCVSFASFMPFILQGCFRSYTALFIPQIQEDDPEFIIDKENFSWIVTIFVLSMPVGSIFGGAISDKFGRKTALQLAFVFFGLGSLGIILTRNIYMIYAAMVLGGIGTGIGLCSMVYVAEIATPRNRGFLSAFTQPTGAIGNLLCNIMVFFVRWKTCATFILAISIIFLIITCFVPESPVWLILNNRQSKAQEVLEWVRNSRTGIKEEMDEIEKQRSKNQSKRKKSCVEKLHVILSSWKPFLIIFVLGFLQQLSGFQILILYGTQFFKSLDIPMDAHMISLIYFSVNIFRAFLSPVASYHLTRRGQLKISGALTGTFWTIVLIYEILFLKSTDKPHFWIVIVALCLYNLACSLGIVYLAFVISGEIFAGENRGLLVGTFGVGYFIISAMVTKLYAPFVLAFGTLWVLAVFASSCFVGVLYAFLILPETGNKTLIEIQEQYFSKPEESQGQENDNVENGPAQNQTQNQTQMQSEMLCSNFLNFYQI